MSPFSRTLGPLRHACALVALCAPSIVAGCAPADDESATDRDDAPSHATPSEDPRGAARGSTAGGAVDKEIKAHYCCAEKKGDRVKRCRNAYLGYVAAALECRAALTDNVLRDGMCSGYKSCEGKISNPDFPDMTGPGDIFNDDFPSGL